MPRKKKSVDLHYTKVTVTLPPDMAAELERRARAKMMHRSVFVQQALLAYFKSNPETV